MEKQAILTRFAELGLLAVLRAPDPAGARRAARGLREGGILGTEITYSSPDAASAIAGVKQSYSDEILVGADTPGGASYLRSLRSQVPGLLFTPTVGVSADNVWDRLAARADAGSELALAGDISSGDFAGIRKKGRRLHTAMREARTDAAPGASR